jgi:hypothetical protein
VVILPKAGAIDDSSSTATRAGHSRTGLPAVSRRTIDRISTVVSGLLQITDRQTCSYQRLVVRPPPSIKSIRNSGPVLRPVLRSRPQASFPPLLSKTRQQSSFPRPSGVLDRQPLARCRLGVCLCEGFSMPLLSPTRASCGVRRWTRSEEAEPRFHPRRSPNKLVLRSSDAPRRAGETIRRHPKLPSGQLQRQSPPGRERSAASPPVCTRSRHSARR